MYNLRARRKELGLTLEQVGDMVGVGKSTVRKWETGDINNMGRTNIANLANALKINPLHIIKDDYVEEKEDISYIYNQLTGDNQNKVYNYADDLLSKQMTVKVYGQSAAGQALTYGDDMVEEEAVSYVPKGADRALYIKGDSMEPVIKDSSIVFYKEQPQVENGEIAIVEIHNEAVTCKKVKFDYEDKKIVLESLNDKYEDMILADNEVRILGKVLL